MNRRRFITASLGLGALAGLSPNVLANQLQRAEQKGIALGSEVSIVAYHEAFASAETAIKAAFTALDQIEELLSLYRPHSEICQLNRERVLEGAHPDTINLVLKAVSWARLTGGAFDPTVQPLWSLHSNPGAPDPTRLEAARRLVDFKQVRVHGTEIRLGVGQEITLNGIAPGFAADRVREVLLAHGIKHALVNTGEFCALGAKPEKAPWRLGIQHPRVRDAYAALVDIQDCFLSTSGDYETMFSEDFSSHHIFDPATGRSPTELASVTVLAPTGIEADALSTAIFVLGARRGLELVKNRTRTEAYLILKDGNSIATPNFPKLS